MAVRKKGRRRLVVGDRLFVWWIGECEPYADCRLGRALTVASEDGRFFVRYYLDQQPEHRFLVVQGREFASLADAGGCWIRVQCPDWCSGGVVRPSDVRSLIDWSLSTYSPRVRMDYRGELLSMLHDS